MELVGLGDEGLRHYTMNGAKLPSRHDCEVTLNLMTDFVHDDVLLLVLARSALK